MYIVINPIVVTKKICSFKMNHFVNPDDKKCPICDAPTKDEVISKKYPSLEKYFSNDDIEPYNENTFLLVDYNIRKEYFDNILKTMSDDNIIYLLISD